MKPNSEYKKIKLACRGIHHVFQTQCHFKCHIITSILVITIGIIFKISLIEWTMLTIAIFGVLITEMINTAFEILTNLVTSNYHPLAKDCKDVASGTVLLSALLAVIIGSIIFYPKIHPIWSTTFGK